VDLRTSLPNHSQCFTLRHLMASDAPLNAYTTALQALRGADLTGSTPMPVELHYCEAYRNCTCCTSQMLL
jgi:hypothetical protein